MEKFQMTVQTIITQEFEVEAEGYDEAIDEAKRLYENGKITDLPGWVKVEVDDAYHEYWWTIDEYEKDKED